MRLADSRVLAPTPAARRIAARTFVDAGASCQLLAFRVVDTHAHALLACTSVDAGQYARRVEIALRGRLRIACPFDPARLKPVRDQWHLQRTVEYILDQERRHGLSSDPAHDGSSLPDLLGWRALGGGLAERVRALVPRLGVRPPLPLEELESTPVQASLLADAAAAALALPDLAGIAPERCLARRAAVRVAVIEQLAVSSVADCLALTRRRVEQIRADPPPAPRLVHAVRMQLRLRSALARGPGVDDLP